MVLGANIIHPLGEALNMGRGVFLHGAPGNGKSALAERIVQAYGPTIWIPRALSVGGEIVRLFDSIHHHEVPLAITLPNGTGIVGGSAFNVRRFWLVAKWSFAVWRSRPIR